MKPKGDDKDHDYLSKLLKAAEELGPKLMQELSASGFFQAPLTYKSRIKDETRAREKIERKRKLKPHYTAESIQDIIGIRFVTLLRTDIADVVRSLFKILEGESHGDAPHLTGATLDEFRHHCSTPPQEVDAAGEWHDSLYDKLKTILGDYESRLLNPPKTLSDRFKRENHQQYSSVHIVIYVRYRLGGHDFRVPIEIQVRSVFEDAWGEIDHMLFYEPVREGIVTGEDKRLAAASDLRVLKAMMDNAAEYAAIISKKDFGRRDDTRQFIAPNLDDADYMHALAQGLTAHRDLLDEFVGLVREKDRIDQTKPLVRNLYAPLAERFADLTSRFNAKVRLEDFPKGDEERALSIAYHLRMEEALCRLLGGGEDQVTKAIAIYETLTLDHPYDNIDARFSEFPTAWFRLAQANVEKMELTNDYEERRRLSRAAFEAYGTSRTLLDQVMAKKDSNQEYVISSKQREYLDRRIERLRGFALWRLSDLRRRDMPEQTPEDLENVREAWLAMKGKALAAMQAMADDPANISGSQLNLLNTAAYIALDGLSLCAHLKADTSDFPNKSVMADMIRLLEMCAKSHDVKTAEKTWHTVMIGALYLDDFERAADAAEKVMTAHVEGDTTGYSHYDREAHERTSRDAWKVLQSTRKKEA